MAASTTKPGATKPAARKAASKKGTGKLTTTKPNATIPKASSTPNSTVPGRTATTTVADAVRTETPALRAVVDRNVAAINAEDLNAAMATIDPDSDGFAETRRLTESVFEDFDLKVTLESFEVKSVSADRAVARIVQRTEKVRGPDFKNNRITADWEFRRSKGVWYITGQVNLDVQPLE